MKSSLAFTARMLPTPPSSAKARNHSNRSTKQRQRSARIPTPRRLANIPSVDMTATATELAELAGAGQVTTEPTTLPECFAALVKIAADIRSLAATIRKIADAAAVLDPPTGAFCHRL